MRPPMSQLSVLNFIEEYFGVSPDKGDGSIETLIAVVLFMLVVTLAVRWAKAKKIDRGSDRPTYASGSSAFG